MNESLRATVRAAIRESRCYTELVNMLETALAQVTPAPSTEPQERMTDQRGFVNGVLYCYGGCGTKYADFPCDFLLPTPLWNRIAIGVPFDDAQLGVSREGRGGVLCPTCIIQRLVALPECTAVFADIDDHREVASAPVEPELEPGGER